MTRKRAERLTGYEIRRVPARDGAVQFEAVQGHERVASAEAPVEWLALKRLVNIVYGIHVRKVLDEYEGRCARCRRVAQLHIHHRRYRSHGGTHQTQNLEPLCWECHRLVHQTEKSR